MSAGRRLLLSHSASDSITRRGRLLRRTGRSRSHTMRAQRPVALMRSCSSGPLIHLSPRWSYWQPLIGRRRKRGSSGCIVEACLEDIEFTNYAGSIMLPSLPSFVV